MHTHFLIALISSTIRDKSDKEAADAAHAGKGFLSPTLSHGEIVRRWREPRNNFSLHVQNYLLKS